MSLSSPSSQLSSPTSIKITDSSQNLILDNFKDHSPILYDGLNRIPAIEDVRNVLIYICFTTLFVAFLIIFPGIRKERVSTFICVTVSLMLGAVILSANFGTNWHVAEASISSPYRAFSREKIFAKVLVRVGLHSVNISLQALAVTSRSEDINFNERFYWFDPLEMKSEHKKALAKGLPFPILTIAEYLSQDEEGFCWGRRYRLSGHYASVCLWAAFCSWLLMNIFLCAVPRYGVYSMQATGLLMLMTDAVYFLLLPLKPLTIPFENQVLTFTFGWNFWIVLLAGLLAVTVGAIVLMIDTMFPHKFSTILEIDYDTPYRYFVGNDAHLFGHSCPHAVASPTSSHDTESTCCAAANSDLHHHHHHHHHLPDDELSSRSSRKARRLSKMKSDASTSTTMSIPIKKNHMDLADRSVSSTTDHAVIMVRVNNNTLIPSTGFNNKAFVHEDHQEVKVLEQRGGGETMMIASRCSNNTTTGTEADSEDSDVSTTIIDGKRAISLHNFAKFTAQQQLRRDNSRHEKSVSSSTQRRIHSSGSCVAQAATPPGHNQHEPAAQQVAGTTISKLTLPVTANVTTTTTSSSTTTSSTPSRRSSSNNSPHVQIDLTSNPAGLW